MASAAETLKRLTLELGGNDAGIVLPDADSMAIAEGLFWGAFINSGQTCACLKRLYVHDRIYDAVCEALAAYAGQIKVGDGLTDDNVLGAASQLASHGIDVVADLPGVGENYQDHPEATVQAEMRDSSSLFGQDRGPAAVGHMLQ